MDTITATFVRHAPAIKPSGIAYGITDYPADLSNFARLNAIQLNTNKKFAVISSELRRARETANLFLRLRAINETIELRSEINEQHLGIFEDKPRNTIPFKSEYSYWLFPPEYKPEGGESFYDVKERVCNFLTTLRGRNIQDFLIFTHGNVMRAAVSILLQIGDDAIKTVSFAHFAFITIKMDRLTGRLKEISFG